MRVTDCLPPPGTLCDSVTARIASSHFTTCILRSASSSLEGGLSGAVENFGGPYSCFRARARALELSIGKPSFCHDEAVTQPASSWISAQPSQPAATAPATQDDLHIYSVANRGGAGAHGTAVGPAERLGHGCPGLLGSTECVVCALRGPGWATRHDSCVLRWLSRHAGIQRQAAGCGGFAVRSKKTFSCVLGVTRQFGAAARAQQPERPCSERLSAPLSRSVGLLASERTGAGAAPG